MQPVIGEGIKAFREKLSNGSVLEMVKIPAGAFLMGSPGSKPNRLGNEKPQHDVRVSSFFMGKYPITQAQWQVVAGLPQVNRELNPDPSHFKGENHPVESISWFDAVEFCARLSQLTGRDYRLPSEAEWEYACRAGTTTPFHFGETITTELANYDGNYSYSRGARGEYRRKTTPVGYFPANAFGLFDMHGNVREWCQDYWHDSYDGAPIDGSAWDFGGDRNLRILRGGSWVSNPRNCRSATRIKLNPVSHAIGIGFRVVCDMSGI